MDRLNDKCVMIIDEDLPLGLIANTAGIMGITLGKQIPEHVGPDIQDKSGNSHMGIIELPVPILKASREKLKEIRTQLFQTDYSGLVVVDFSDVAQTCNDYEAFTRKAAAVDQEDFNYLGIGICGAKKLVNKLTGSLPLLR